MFWKILAIVLIVFIVLLCAYSGGFLVADDVDDGAEEVTESFELSGTLQSDFWDGFNDWIQSNLLWIALAGIVVFGVVSFAKSRN